MLTSQVLINLVRQHFTTRLPLKSSGIHPSSDKEGRKPVDSPPVYGAVDACVFCTQTGGELYGQIEFQTLGTGTRLRFGWYGPPFFSCRMSYKRML